MFFQCCGKLIQLAEVHAGVFTVSQVTYNIERSEKIGNEPIVEALRALDKFEVAVGGDSRLGGYAAVPVSPGSDTALPMLPSSLGIALIKSQPAPEAQLVVASPTPASLIALDMVGSPGSGNRRLQPGAPSDVDVEEVINYRVHTLRNHCGCLLQWLMLRWPI